MLTAHSILKECFRFFLWRSIPVHTPCWKGIPLTSSTELAHTAHPHAWLPLLLWMEWPIHILASGVWENMVGKALLRESNPHSWKCVLGIQIKLGSWNLDFSPSISPQPIHHPKLAALTSKQTPNHPLITFSASTFIVAINFSHWNYSMVFCPCLI